MIDILYYELNGFEHKKDVNTLQNEFTQTFNQHNEFPIRRILELLPLQIASPGKILARGKINWLSEGVVGNEYESNQVLEFGDPALGKFYLSAPAKIKSKYIVDNVKKTFVFLLEGKNVILQLNKLVEEGFNRTAFQIMVELHFQKDKFITVLVDQNDSKKITHLVVLLSPDARVGKLDNLSSSLISTSYIDIESDKKVNVRHISALSDKCCLEILDGGQEWYVFYRKGSGNPGICVEHNGSTIEGGLVAWEQIGGPFGSEQEAKNFSNTCGRCQ